MLPELSTPPNVGGRLELSQAIIEVCRSVAQPGSAPALGAGGPRFESLYSDHFSLITLVSPSKTPRYANLGTVGCNAFTSPSIIGRGATL
jgi:hypothetical protein